MARIFISYRHDDAAAYAMLLRESLSERYDEDKIVLGAEAIPPGLEFVEVIDRAVGSADVVIVLIGKDWLADPQGRRRLDDPDDFVLREIEAALERGLPVIPVLVDGAAMPSADDLPGSIKQLAWLQPLDTSVRGWRSESEALLRSVDRFLQPVVVEHERLPQEPPDRPWSDVEPAAPREPAPGVPRALKRWFRWKGRRVKPRQAQPQTVRVGSSSERPASEEDVVECSVFAPPAADSLDTILVQVFAHLVGQAKDARSLAEEFDAEAERRAVKTLEALVRRGSRLVFDLRMSRSMVSDPVQSLVWRGRPESVQFEVAVAGGGRRDAEVGTVTVTLDSVPLGHIKFTLGVAPSGERVQDRELVGDDAKRYSSAFVSYSSKDRRKVLERVQVLRSVGIDYFQDLLDLDPGDRWERELYRGIDRCDLFLLFWSSHAKASPWVRKEVQYALDHKRGDELAPPELRPVIIEGPPVPQPWPEVAHLHFGDRFVYLLAGLDDGGPAEAGAPPA